MLDHDTIKEPFHERQVGFIRGKFGDKSQKHITNRLTLDLIQIPLKEGLKNDVICQILEDNRGNLWLGSYGGVFRVSKAQLDRASGQVGWTRTEVTFATLARRAARSSESAAALQ